MYKKLLLIFFVILSIRVNSQILTNRYIQVNHSPGISLIDSIDKIELETANDTPYSRSRDIVFTEGWSRFFGKSILGVVYTLNRDKNTVGELSTSHKFFRKKIVDLSFNITYKVKYKKNNKYFCVDNLKENCVISVFKINDKTYIIIDYEEYSYIHATK